MSRGNSKFADFFVIAQPGDGDTVGKSRSAGGGNCDKCTGNRHFIYEYITFKILTAHKKCSIIVGVAGAGLPVPPALLEALFSARQNTVPRKRVQPDTLAPTGGQV